MSVECYENMETGEITKSRTLAFEWLKSSNVGLIAHGEIKMIWEKF